VREREKESEKEKEKERVKGQRENPSRSLERKRPSKQEENIIQTRQSIQTSLLQAWLLNLLDARDGGSF
jgi:hypothetical protein